MDEMPRSDSPKSRCRLDSAGDPVLAREIFAIHVFLKIPRARSLESMTPRLEEHKEEGVLHERSGDANDTSAMSPAFAGAPHNPTCHRVRRSWRPSGTTRTLAPLTGVAAFLAFAS